jgi:antitoxin component YwqK of YwqJK toxin-antitoxin module
MPQDPQKLREEILAKIAANMKAQYEKNKTAIPDGIQEIRDHDNVIRQKVTIKNGQKNGLTEYYSKDGQLVFAECFVNDVREGPAMAFNPDGEIAAKLHYTKGALEGPCDFYLHEKIMCHANFAHDKLDGDATVYDTDGNVLAKLHFVDGKKEGLVEAFNKLGHVMASAEYKANKKEGYTKSFNDDDNLTRIAHYINNILEGEVTEFYDNGRVKKVEKYQHGKLIEAPKKY